MPHGVRPERVALEEEVRDLWEAGFLAESAEGARLGARCQWWPLVLWWSPGESEMEGRQPARP